jgi:hypothetical protein
MPFGLKKLRKRLLRFGGGSKSGAKSAKKHGGLPLPPLGTRGLGIRGMLAAVWMRTLCAGRRGATRD